MSFKKNIAKLVGRTFMPEVFNSFYKSTKIVFYHGVEITPIKNSIIQANQMSFDDFKKQISFLERKFEIICIKEFERRFNLKTLKGCELILTFDDGYRNNYTIVAPYLKSKNIPFTVFICTDLIEKQLKVPTFYVRAAIYSNLIPKLNISYLNKVYDLTTEVNRNIANKELIEIVKSIAKTDVDKLLEAIKSNFTLDQLRILDEDFSSEALMTWEEVVDLAANYNCTIGSHCKDHSILHSIQSEEVVIDQLEESKEMIEKHLGECRYFAFPNGDRNSVSDFSIQKASEIYNFGFAVNGSNVKYSDHKGYISRFSLAPDYNAFKVQTLILSNIK